MKGIAWYIVKAVEMVLFGSQLVLHAYPFLSLSLCRCLYTKAFSFAPVLLTYTVKQYMRGGNEMRPKWSPMYTILM